METPSPLERACNEVGGQSALAKRLGCTPAAVNQWLKVVRPIPRESAADIERITDGKVSCEDLLPAVAWVRVPDAEWPHPGGRPCVDVARRDEASAAPEAA